MNILAVIPARSGSKGIPHKNIGMFQGKPLLAHSVAHARESARVTRTLVSTDSELYAAIAREHGAEVPFMRPAEFSGDQSTDLDVFRHALQWLEQHEGYRPDICVHLRPTCPIRDPVDIDRAVQMLMEEPIPDSVRSVVEAPETPFKMWFCSQDGFLDPVVTRGFHEPYNMPRQAIPQAYLQNANIDVVWSRVILQQNSMTGRKIRPMIMKDFHDVDTAAQLSALTATGAQFRGKTFVFDLDGVLATLTPNNDYSKAEPISPNIVVVNALFEAGNTIEVFTARGSKTGQDWTAVTKAQLEQWGVRHHKLTFGKPFADYYVDDRMISVHDLSQKVRELGVL